MFVDPVNIIYTLPQFKV